MWCWTVLELTVILEILKHNIPLAECLSTTKTHRDMLCSMAKWVVLHWSLYKQIGEPLQKELIGQ